MATTALRRRTEVKGKTKSGPARAMRKYRAIYLMLLPTVAFYLLFAYAPMYGVLIAFKDFYMTKGVLGSPWVGLKHFETLFSLVKFRQVFMNTVQINFLRLLFGFPAPLILALLLNELKNAAFKRVVQTIVYLPYFISWVTIAGVMFMLLSSGGAVNTLISQMGFEKVNFLANTGMFRPLLVVSGIWKEVGWGTIIYLAALFGISPELYEAAAIDGANRWTRLLRITLPSIMPTTGILLILTLGNLMTGNFDQVFNLYNASVYEVGDIIETYMYRIGLAEGKYSLGAAVGLFLNVINFALLLTVNRVVKKTNGYGLY
jgi:putative aldouronate transport system permease protein